MQHPRSDGSLSVLIITRCRHQLGLSVCTQHWRRLPAGTVHHPVDVAVYRLSLVILSWSSSLVVLESSALEQLVSYKNAVDTQNWGRILPPRYSGSRENQRCAILGPAIVGAREYFVVVTPEHFGVVSQEHLYRKNTLVWCRQTTLVWYHRNTFLVRTLWCGITGTLWCGITGTLVS